MASLNEWLRLLDMVLYRMTWLPPMSRKLIACGPFGWFSGCTLDSHQSFVFDLGSCILFRWMVILWIEESPLPAHIPESFSSPNPFLPIIFPHPLISLFSMITS